METEYQGMPNPFYKSCEIEIDSKIDGEPEKNYHILKQILQVCYDLSKKSPSKGEGQIIASQNKEIDVLKIVMERWSKKVDYMDIISLMARKPEFKFEVLKYILGIFGTHLTMYKILLKVMDSPDFFVGFSLAVSRLEEVYGAQDSIIWENLLKDAERFKLDENKEVIRFLQVKIKSMALYATVPNWVRILPGETTLTLPKSGGPDQVESIELANNIIDKALEQYTFTEEDGKMADIRSNLENFILTATDLELKTLQAGMTDPKLQVGGKEPIVNIIKDSQIKKADIKIDDDPKKYIGTPERSFGPSNAIYKQNCITAPGGIGPCRMLYCCCDDYDPETSEDILSEKSEFDRSNSMWFTGCCDICYRKIRDISHALRNPLVEGGWSGVFCSFRCLLVHHGGADKIPDLEKSVIMKIEKVIKVYGITDRTKLQ